MTRTSQPNFYVVNADGSVAAIFPGGARIPAASVLIAGGADPIHSIEWFRESDGAYVAAIRGFNSDAPEDSALVLEAVDPDDLTFTGAKTGITLDVNGFGGAAPSAVNASARDTGLAGASAVLINGLGESSFIQVPPSPGRDNVKLASLPVVAVPAILAGGDGVGAAVASTLPDFGSTLKRAWGSFTTSGGRRLGSEVLAFGVDGGGNITVTFNFHNPSAVNAPVGTFAGMLYVEY